MGDKKCHLFCLSPDCISCPPKEKTSLAFLQYLVYILLLLCLLECDLFEVKGLDIHVRTKLNFFMNKWLNRLNFYQESNALYFLTILNRVKGQIKTLLGTSKQVFFEIFFSCVYIYTYYMYIHVQVSSHQPRVLSVTLHSIVWAAVSQAQELTTVTRFTASSSCGDRRHRKGRLLCECCGLTKTKLRSSC